MVDIFAEAPHVRDYVIDLVVGQQIPKRRHNLGEPPGWPPMDDHGLPIAVRLRRRPGTIRKIGEGIPPLEHRARFRSTLPLAAVARNATTLVDLFPIPHIGTLRIAQGLCGNKQMPAKKHDKTHCRYAPSSL